MKQILFNNMFYTYLGPLSLQWTLNMWAIGEESDPSGFLMTIGVTNSNNGQFMFETSCELKKNQLTTTNFQNLIQQYSQPAYTPPVYTPPVYNPPPIYQTNQIDLSILTDFFDKALGLKKENGVWIPKISEGDTVIVDKAGAGEIKVLDPVEQAYEKIPKRALNIDKDSCTCPMRHVLVKGCPRLQGASKCAV